MVFINFPTNVDVNVLYKLHVICRVISIVFKTHWIKWTSLYLHMIQSDWFQFRYAGFICSEITYKSVLVSIICIAVLCKIHVHDKIQHHRGIYSCLIFFRTLINLLQFCYLYVSHGLMLVCEVWLCMAHMVQLC